MLVFHAGTPFPLMDEDSYSYPEAQAHAERVDKWLGLQTERIENALVETGCRASAPNSTKDHQNLWIGLATESLLTPYVEIRGLLHFLKPKPSETVIDLGAAYGRVGIVIGHHYPQVQFIGYEFVGERLRESQRLLGRLKYPNVRMEHADLASKAFQPARADYYFIYDYGKPAAIEKTLHDLRRFAENREIKVIARGPTCPTVIASRHKWLVKLEKCGRSTVFVSRLHKELTNAGKRN
ncbi:MAG: class I SAM-dependent methyltransferase [Bdellovibrionia bacterium]